MKNQPFIEWPTVGLFVLVYAAWAGAVFFLAGGVLWLSVGVASVAIAFQGSLQHEALHGHPTGWAQANSALAWPPLTLVIPYLRFRDTHLDHHRDNRLTDPFDDPESNFLDPEAWHRLPRAMKTVYAANNTLVGRMVLGPVLGTWCFLRSDLRHWRTDPRVVQGWLWHGPGLAAVLGLVALSPMPLWAYALAVYGALGLLRIRTFLEHRAHELPRARSVIIEDRGPLALLFLNNNLHAVHHSHPGVAWYRLPRLYRAERARFLALNEGYRYGSYGDVFRAHAFRRKDPVAHPLMEPKG